MKREHEGYGTRYYGGRTVLEGKVGQEEQYDGGG